MERDQRNIDALLTLGWRVAVVWECEMRKDLTETVDRTERWIMDDAILG